MCEWLSREEWCDARLLCGGRAFSAHRAVLASVSPFLRRILLSCPMEEPTLIVLPDFDLQALTAVLYYIYNGEVTIHRQKLDKFLDIVKAMQIYIDQEYLMQCVNVGIEYNVNKCPPKERIFVLRTESDSNTSIITFKKLFQHAFQNTKDVDNKDLQAPNRNEHFKSVLGNLQSAHVDRQSDHFLRGSFMETYPRNRSCNGRAGVPAIPNARNLSPTSLLFTNANVNGHLNPDTVNMSSDASAYNIKLASFPTSYQDLALTELRRKLSLANLSDALTGAKSTVPLVEIFPLHNDKRMQSDGVQKTFIPYANYKTVIDTPRFSGYENSTELKWEKTDSSTTSDTSLNKVTILNKALESPWCPRLPNSFRPFRRKGHSLNNCDPNDDNNNIQVIPPTAKDERLNGPPSIDNSGNSIPSPEDNKDQGNRLPICSSHPTPHTEHRAGRYACTECGKTFSQLRNYKYHVSVHRGTREFAASCAVCGKSFNDRGYLSSHMKIHRNRKEYKCSQCPKSFNQRVAYNMHVRIHTGVKPHVCPTCGKAFSRKMLLKQHQRTHSGERPYACPHCEKRFADRSNMTLHLRLHTGVKPFKCPMCPKSFTKKHHLKSHVNFHTGAKPYSCPRCRLAFTQSSNMRTHLKRCTAPEATEVTTVTENT